MSLNADIFRPAMSYILWENCCSMEALRGCTKDRKNTMKEQTNCGRGGPEPEELRECSHI